MLQLLALIALIWVVASLIKQHKEDSVTRSIYVPSSEGQYQNMTEREQKKFDKELKKAYKQVDAVIVMAIHKCERARMCRILRKHRKLLHKMQEKDKDGSLLREKLDYMLAPARIFVPDSPVINIPDTPSYTPPPPSHRQKDDEPWQSKLAKEQLITEIQEAENKLNYTRSQIDMMRRRGMVLEADELEATLPSLDLDVKGLKAKKWW